MNLPPVLMEHQRCDNVQLSRCYWGNPPARSYVRVDTANRAKDPQNYRRVTSTHQRMLELTEYPHFTHVHAWCHLFPLFVSDLSHRNLGKSGLRVSCLGLGELVCRGRSVFLCVLQPSGRTEPLCSAAGTWVTFGSQISDEVRLSLSLLLVRL